MSLRQQCIAALLINVIGDTDCDALREAGFWSFDSHDLTPVTRAYSMLFASRAMFPGLDRHPTTDAQHSHA